MYEINGHKLLQYPGELEELCAIFQAEGVRSYLEIGCKFGGSLWTIGTSLPKGSRIVAVDLMRWPQQTAQLRQSIADLIEAGYEVIGVPGDSSNPELVKHVYRLGPFDACLIDGDHKLAGIKKDWQNYGPMCRLVAFHDINWHRNAGEPQPYVIDVPQFWQGIKGDYRHIEIKRDKRDNGIGVLWR